MSDSLCGPSNALQNFKNHSSVDRSLQQDRVVNRLNTPNQGFRSSPGPNGGLVDSEFDAFQAGHAHAPPPLQQHSLQRIPLQHFAPGPAPQLPQAHQAAPDWASDFQRLALGPTQASQAQRQPGFQAPQASNQASSWHQDFLQQTNAAPQAPMQQHNMFGGMPQQNFGMPMMMGNTMGGMMGAPMSEVAQGKQRAQDNVPQFDEEAFERAFAQAQDDAMQEAAEQMKLDAQQADQMRQDLINQEQAPVLRAVADKYYSVYAAIKLEEAVRSNDVQKAQEWLGIVEDQQRNGAVMTDPSEAKICIDMLQNLADQNTSVLQRDEIETTVRTINERLMSTYPLHSAVEFNQERIWNDLRDMGYTRHDLRPAEQPAEEQQQQPPAMNDDDEMAATAGKLLDRVADNTSDKFKNSQFLELMRKLRDREVRVEGDKMVEVSESHSSSSPSAAQPVSSPPVGGNYSNNAGGTEIPPIDRGILNHAALDFAPPMDADDYDPGHEPSMTG